MPGRRQEFQQAYDAFKQSYLDPQVLHGSRYPLFEMVDIDAGQAAGLRLHRDRRAMGHVPVPVTRADRRRVKLDTGTAIFRIGTREAPATLLAGDVAEPILGVESKGWG
jgi:hypothetical protein